MFLGGTAASGGSSEKWPSQVGGAEPRLIRYGSRMAVRMERTVSVWISYLLAVCGRMDLTVVLWISLPPYPSFLRHVPSRLADPPPSPKEPSDIMHPLDLGNSVFTVDPLRVGRMSLKHRKR